MSDTRACRDAGNYTHQAACRAHTGGGPNKEKRPAISGGPI